MWEESGHLSNTFITLFYLIQKRRRDLSISNQYHTSQWLEQIGLYLEFLYGAHTIFLQTAPNTVPYINKQQDNWKHRGHDKPLRLACLAGLQVNHTLNTIVLCSQESVTTKLLEGRTLLALSKLSKWCLLRLLLEFLGPIVKCFSFQMKHKVLKHTSKSWLFSIPHFKQCPNPGPLFLELLCF